MTRRFVNCDRGTSAVEFALVVPALVFLLIGLMDFGRYMYFGIVTAHAARAGVQYGARNLVTVGDRTNIDNAALQDAPDASLSITPSYFCSKNGSVVGCTASGVTYYVQVQASGTFRPFLTYPGIPSTITITKTAVMRVSNQ